MLWRLRCNLSLRAMAEMFLTLGCIFSYEEECDWEANLTPALAENLVGDAKARLGLAATLMRHIAGCGADGDISIARSIAMAPWRTSF